MGRNNASNILKYLGFLMIVIGFIFHLKIADVSSLFIRGNAGIMAACTGVIFIFISIIIRKK